MRSDKKAARMAEIEAVAYGLFADHGFDSTSMLAVAKAAKASNETMYRWYGDKAGLFESMVRANAERVKEVLAQAVQDDLAAREALDALAPALLGMLLSDEAILLNRAAASDPTGGLGHLLAQGGREDVLPLIARVLQQGVDEGVLSAPKESAIETVFLHLLVGDRQVRRVIGTMAAPSADQVAEQARVGLALFMQVCGR